MYTPHGCGPIAARAVSDVPSAIVAIRLANAHANRKLLAMLLSNFVFMIIFLSNFLFVVLAFLGFPPWEVISGRSLLYSVEFGRSLRGKLQKTSNHGLRGCHGLRQTIKTEGNEGSEDL